MRKTIPARELYVCDSCGHTWEVQDGEQDEVALHARIEGESKPVRNAVTDRAHIDLCPECTAALLGALLLDDGRPVPAKMPEIETYPLRDEVRRP